MKFVLDNQGMGCGQRVNDYFQKIKYLDTVL